MTDHKSNCKDILDETFKIMWTNRLVDSYVLCQDDIDIWSFNTFMPYQDDCYTLNHHKVASFNALNYTNNMSLPNAEIFPKKMKSFFNCPLYVAPTLIEPLVLLQNTSDDGNQYVGIDIEILKQISKTLNFAIKYKTSNDGTGHGVIFQNGTATGNLDLVCVNVGLTINKSKNFL